MSNRCAAVIAAGGSGSRFGGANAKQFQMFLGRPMLIWSVETLLAHEAIGRVVVAAPPDRQAETAAILPNDPRLLIVAGGASRTASVLAGLEALADFAPDKVLIHDAARPGLSAGVIDELVAALDQADAACPALPMTDALKETLPGGALRTVDRTRHVRMQTPQAFRFPIILEACRNVGRKAGDAPVDDLALLEGAGTPVALTPGRPELMKITHAEDLALAERLIGGSAMRIGSGFDVHAFEPGDGVMLCGVKIPHTAKLKGHSDADVAWHALTDAILGALAAGDIGDHFPPSDPQWKGAASIVFLKHAADLATSRGWRIVNADVTVICERPKVSPHRDAMRASTAEVLGLSPDCISVKATTTEKLGFTGRGEGIAAQAVVSLAR
ncbi:MAG: bifunctional 2-C-methyl-D-erythritol 4-phosphate cytidylyltransferase/2-C-methyl-D-erythritol 2,4-cyclodiphosphate synthase [Hyphomonadaceae bacterium]